MNLTDVISPEHFAFRNLASRKYPQPVISFQSPLSDEDCGSVQVQFNDTQVSLQVFAKLVQFQNPDLFKPVKFALPAHINHFQEILMLQLNDVPKQKTITDNETGQIFRVEYNFKFTVSTTGGSLLGALMQCISEFKQNGTVISDLEAEHSDREKVYENTTKQTIKVYGICKDIQIEFPNEAEQEIMQVITEIREGDLVVYRG
ncbi:Hypothetical_protein [Hexamita inflata]|uniref:Hypothetical_protein n=1 Tax=Hexamita inflata TaxID=28002 RepID=A0ABP1GGS5_9EUKA